MEIQQQDKKYNRFAKHICAMLVLMYGIVPVAVDRLGLFPAPYADINFVFSAVLFFFIYFLPDQVRLTRPVAAFDLSHRTGLTAFIFVLAAIVFFLFPWHDDRESAGASLAAFFRALWFVTAISYIKSPEKPRLVVLLLTVVLMYIDQSRTYFLLLLIILAAKSRYSIPMLTLSVGLGLVLAAVRVSDSSGGLDFLLYGVIGEGYNATKAVGQIYDSSSQSINVFMHMFQTFLQPLTFPFDFVFSKLIGPDYPLQDSYLASLVTDYLGEVFNPMGGWYVSGDFVYYGYFGILLMCLYILITWVVTKMLLDGGGFPFGSFFLFIAIKSTPYIYWKFLFYILAVRLLYKFLLRFNFKFQ